MQQQQQQQQQDAALISTLNYQEQMKEIPVHLVASDNNGVPFEVICALFFL